MDNKNTQKSAVPGSIFGITFGLLLCMLMFSTAQAQLIGPVDPPPLGAVFSQTGVPHDGMWGRATGKTYSYSNVNHANNTDVFWGVADGAVKLSLDGNDFSDPGEIMSYDPALSDLAAGLVFWSGTTTIIVPTSVSTPVFSRFRAIFTDGVTGAPLALTLATDEGLSADVGAVFKVVNSAASFDVNVQFQAATILNGSYEPHLDFFDPRTGQDQDGMAHSSLVRGFYYINTPPYMTAVVNLEVGEAGTVTVDSTHLSADDYESGPDGLTYTLNPADQASIPRYGELDNDGTVLATDDTFTQSDINGDKISYTHDGSQTTQDSYVFTVHDEQGAIAADGQFTLFQNTINITTTNDPPTAIDGSGVANIDGTFAGVFEGEDEEDDTLEFSVESVDSGSAQIIDALAGTFSYTGPAGFIGDATIEFQVWDGNLFADVPGSFVVTVPEDGPPTAIDGSGVANIDGTFAGVFEGVDEEGGTLEFSVESVDFGSAQIIDALAGTFSYTAAPGFNGDATIEFQVSDGNSFADVPGSFVVTVPDAQVAVLHVGDLLIANGDKLIIHNLPENTDWVLSEGNNFTKLKALDFDGENSIYVLDSNNGLIRVDPVTGDQAVVTTGDNFVSDNPAGIAVEDINHILVSNLDFEGTPSVMRIDTSNGSIVTHFSGDLMGVPTSTAVSEQGKVYVSDASAFEGGVSEIVEIDPATGVQYSISLGGDLLVPLALSVENDGNIVVADAPFPMIEGSANRILRISTSLPGGQGPAGVPDSQTTLSEGGEILLALTDVTTGYNGKVYAANGTNVIDIDPVSGVQVIVNTEPVVDNPTNIIVYFKDGIFKDSFDGGHPQPD